MDSSFITASEESVTEAQENGEEVGTSNEAMHFGEVFAKFVRHEKIVSTNDVGDATLTFTMDEDNNCQSQAPFQSIQGFYRNKSQLFAKRIVQCFMISLFLSAIVSKGTLAQSQCPHDNFWQ